jgi:chemotaxis family two-component system response regulator Rcp1
MHILLVEDCESDIFLFRHALKSIKMPIVLSVVEDGEQALAFLFHRVPYAQVEQPDIILLDLNLPATSGFEVLAALEHDPRLKFIPVIILTTSDHPDDIDRCYELGANAYLTKPFGLENLNAVVKTTVEFWSGCKFRTRAHEARIGSS